MKRVREDRVGGTEGQAVEALAVEARKASFEKALMGFLRPKGNPIPRVDGGGSGFRLVGLTEAEMNAWGGEFRQALLNYEREFRGTQHLLTCEAPKKEQLGFRPKLRAASSSIARLMLEHRGALSRLPGLGDLYQGEFGEGAGWMRDMASSFLHTNCSRLMRRMEAKTPLGCGAALNWRASSPDWSTGIVAEMRLTRGQASKMVRSSFSIELDGGTLMERFERLIVLWREMQSFCEETLGRETSWPSAAESASAERERCQRLMDEWVRTLRPADSESMARFGPELMANWARSGMRSGRR